MIIKIFFIAICESQFPSHDINKIKENVNMNSRSTKNRNDENKNFYKSNLQNRQYFSYLNFISIFQSAINIMIKFIF